MFRYQMGPTGHQGQQRFAAQGQQLQAGAQRIEAGDLAALEEIPQGVKQGHGQCLIINGRQRVI